MTSTAYSTAGSTLYVSASLPATPDPAGFAALSWSKVAEVTDMGTIGGKVNLISHNPIDSAVVVKLKGTTNPGTLAIKMARAISQAGQAILKAAETSYNPISVRITLQNGEIMYCKALCMGYETSIGSVDQVTGASVNLEVSEVVVYA